MSMGRGAIARENFKPIGYRKVSKPGLHGPGVCWPGAPRPDYLAIAAW